MASIVPTKTEGLPWKVRLKASAPRWARSLSEPVGTGQITDDYNGEMYRTCHRCHADLPGELTTGAAGYGDEDKPLFCPRCGAPQILLPEYMRAEIVAGNPAEGTTTGAVPPPRAHMVDWPVALTSALPMAIATGVLAVASFAVPPAGLLNTLCILGGSGVALGVYRSRRPLARMDGRVGLRVGLLTGLLMCAAMGTCLALTGTVERVGGHGLTGFDHEIDQYFALIHTQMTVSMQNQNQDPVAQQHVLRLFMSPEGRAGWVLAWLGFIGGFVLVLTSALGGFAGLLQTRRRALRRGD
jgi:hypothetical protein